MRWINVSVGPVPARVAPMQAAVAQCPDCGHREWYVFLLPPGKRPYVQCCHCDRIEAVDGKPSAELEVYALADAADDGPLHPMTLPEGEI